MANNFHDIGGLLMVGVDLHFSLLVPGLVPFMPFIPFPQFRVPHLNLLHPFTMGGNQKPTVLFNGRPSVVHWHQPKFLWPYLNLPPFPFDILIPLDIAFGVQTCWLPKSTVFITGEPATCTNIAGPISTNLDCWDLANIPSSLVVQPGTVQTTATLADYAMGLKHFAIDFAIAVAFNVLGDFALGFGGRLANRALQALTRSFTRRFGDGLERAGRRTANSIRNRFARGPDVSNTARRAAARNGRSPYQRGARERVSEDFVNNNALNQPASEALTGIDLNLPVEVVDIPPPDTMNQYVRPHGHPGNWFDPKPNGVPQPGDAIGLNTSGRHPRDFTVPPGDHQGLSSTAGEITDNWTDPANPLHTNGGGPQILVGDTTKDAISAATPPWTPPTP